MLILFDIDGTLLLSKSVGIRAFIRAMSEVLDQEIEYTGRRFAGSLDPLIWRGLCAEHGVDRPHVWHDRFRARYAEHLAAALAEPGTAYALPGIGALLDRLGRDADVSLGLVTGNYPETGRMKIAAAGIDPDQFVDAAWGVDGVSRRVLPTVARERLAARTGRRVAPERTVIIGDTPNDVDCARASGVRCLAVATGLYSVAELASAGAEDVVEDLGDTDAILEWFSTGTVPSSASSRRRSE